MSFDLTMIMTRLTKLLLTKESYNDKETEYYIDNLESTILQLSDDQPRLYALKISEIK